MIISLQRIIHLRKFGLAFLLNIFLCLPVVAQQTYGPISNFIAEKPAEESDFPIVSLDHTAASLQYDTTDYKSVIRAIGDLQSDINRVTGIKPEIVLSGTPADYEIIIGTLGKSKLINELGIVSNTVLTATPNFHMIITIKLPRVSGTI